MIEALNGVAGDKASYLDYGYFGVLSADFDENGMSTGEYTPKQSYYALQNLASLLGGKIDVVDLPVIFHREIAWHLGKTMTIAGYEANYGSFKLEKGNHVLAYWYPANLMTTEYEGAVTLEISMGEEYYLIDPMDGSVFRVDNIKVDKFGTAMLECLPIRDYPLFLVCGNFEYDEVTN